MATKTPEKYLYENIFIESMELATLILFWLIIKLLDIGNFGIKLN